MKDGGFLWVLCVPTLGDLCVKKEFAWLGFTDPFYRRKQEGTEESESGSFEHQDREGAQRTEDGIFNHGLHGLDGWGSG